MADKTNAMRLLDGKKIRYETHEYDNVVSGVEVAHAIGRPLEVVFKTLVTVGKSGSHYVFVIPVQEELDLKKAAKTVGEKAVEMVKSKELLPLTGYIHGGCSPIGMKKFFRTVLHQTASSYETICFSGGRIGLQIETSAENLGKLIRFEYADLIKNESGE
ncbi:MAG: Cys-tRNA(Pro) deacylase [Ruminococcaceae bacterium]|nr:Cys-tRNA(Pro) deacylase [Oscillospiraceae bacterium]